MTKLELDTAFKEKVRHLFLEKGRSVKNIARSTYRTQGYVQMVVDSLKMRSGNEVYAKEAEGRGAVKIEEAA